MNRIARIAGYFHIIVLFSFIAGYYSNSIYTAENEFSRYIPTEKNGISVLLPFYLSCPTLPSENNVKSYGHSPITTIKHPAQQFNPSGKSAELIMFGLFTEYHFYSLNIIDRLRPEDITFPFHYFW